MARDLRKYASQTTFRLILGALILLFVVGLGLIWWLYGLKGALLGFFCLLAALLPLGLILFFIFGLDAVVKKINRD
jgi:hypothetical protein